MERVKPLVHLNSTVSGEDEPHINWLEKQIIETFIEPRMLLEDNRVLL